jgi:hypothetical protein
VGNFFGIVSLGPLFLGRGKRVTSEPPSEPDAQRSVVSSVSDEGEPIDGASYDRVIGHLFGCGVDIAAVLSDDQLEDRAVERLRDAIDKLEMAIRDIRTIVLTQLGEITL